MIRELCVCFCVDLLGSHLCVDMCVYAYFFQQEDVFSVVWGRECSFGTKLYNPLFLSLVASHSFTLLIPAFCCV